MTKEEIEKQMWVNYDEGYKAGCSETIKKACEWINENIYTYTWIDYTQMEFGINRSDLLSALKQAMEEQHRGNLRGISPNCEGVLWHDAQGDYLPEIDREVIVLLDNGKVCFAHRPVESYTGISIVNHSEMEEYYPERYGKGGWNIPDVEWWLDVEMPQKGGEE